MKCEPLRIVHCLAGRRKHTQRFAEMGNGCFVVVVVRRHPGILSLNDPRDDTADQEVRKQPQRHVQKTPETSARCVDLMGTVAQILPLPPENQDGPDNYQHGLYAACHASVDDLKIIFMRYLVLALRDKRKT